MARDSDPEPDYYDCANCYGNGCLACGMKGRVESQRRREEREEYEDRKADAQRKGEAMLYLAYPDRCICANG